MYGCRRYYFDWKTDGLDYYKDIGSNSSGVNDCRSDHQSLADIDVNTGTDTYIRPETAGNYACTDDYGTVAAE